MARTEIQPVCFFINKNSIGTLLDPFLRCCLWLMSDTKQRWTGVTATM